MSSRVLIDDLRRWAGDDIVPGDLRSHILAAAEALEAAEWRDISEAPKDGTVIELYAPARTFDGKPVPERITVGSWIDEEFADEQEIRDEYGAWQGTRVVGVDYPAHWMSWDGGFTEEHPPTHWKPLPAPPAERGKG